MNDDLKKWKTVKPIFEDLFDYPLPVALKKLVKMDHLKEEEKSAVRKLLFGIHTKNTLIESSSQEILNKHLSEFKDLSGTQIGEYHLISLISKGGMSSIYLAERTDSSIQKKVAIKVLSHWLTSKESQSLFNHELMVLSRLRHPNIVTMHHGGVSENGDYFMVMDYLENATPLDQYVDLFSTTRRDIIKIALTVAKAISYAHGHLVIHRDLKSMNILIDDNGHVFVVDFGIASSENGNNDKSLRVYTPEIASPEQILGEKITVTTDIFSLAATVLGLLLKKPALPEVEPSSYDPVGDEKHIAKALDESDLDHELIQIFHKALDINPNNRYESMNRFAADLGNWLENKPISILSDSRAYYLKKIISRNKLVSFFAALTLVVLLTSIVLIGNYANNAFNAAKRADASIHFLTEILNQADPFQAKKGEISIKEILAANHDITLDQVNGDWSLKADLHETLGDIYLKLGLFNDAINQFQASLTVRNQLYPVSDLETLKIQNTLANLYFGIKDIEPSIQVSTEVIDTLNKYQINDIDIKVEAMTTLMQAYGNYAGSNVYDEQKFNEVKSYLLKTVDSGKISNKESLIKVLSRLAIEVQKDKDFERAEQYFKTSLQLTEEIYGKVNYDYQLLYHDYAIAKIRQGQLDQAESMLTQTIEDISDIDINNSMLGRSWETYSTLLMMKGRPAESIEALNKATVIFEHLGDSTGLYYALSKRAMYLFENYRFLEGINDQLRFLPDLLLSTDSKSPTFIASSAHLMLMLYAINENELANQIMDILLTSISPEDNQFKNILAYLAYSGISNWYSGNLAKAEQFYHYLSVNNPNNDRSLYKLFNYLMTQDIQEGLDMDGFFNEENEMTFYTRLRFVIQYNDHKKTAELDEDKLSQLCELNKPFIRFKNIEVKQLFLDNCRNIYQLHGLPVPDEIIQVNSQINHAVDVITLTERQKVITATEQFINQYINNEKL